MYSKLFLFLCTVYGVNSAKILGFFPIPSVSHQVVFQPIWKELALRGHEVTVLSPITIGEDIPNLTEINTGSFIRDSKKIVAGTAAKMCSSAHNLMRHFKLSKLLERIFEMEHTEPELLNFINTTEQYDLILLEIMYPMAYAMAGKFQAPVVGISSMDIFLNTNDAVGNPTHPIVSPDIFFDFYDDLTFFERVKSVWFNFVYRFMYNYYILPQADKAARKYYGEDIPYLGDIERNISMVLVNRNPILGGVRTGNPAIVDISGMHLKPKKPLPEDLKELLDQSPEGVVYFSMGSNVKSANFSDDVRKVICDALGSLPYKVIWKYETDYLPGKPDNVILKKWLPQQDLLGHPNIKVFITQGGIQSIEEAVANEVPMVTIPFYLDQFRNCLRTKDLGISRYIDFGTLNKEELVDAIKDIAENKKYRENIAKTKRLLEDEPMTGLQKAIWWIEYVIRNEGARHLRSPAADMPYYKYFMLDVLVFSLFIFIGIVYFNLRILKFVSVKVRKLKTD